MYSGKKILGLIPARGGSKGVHKKNIAPLAGKPLMSWCYEAAKDSDLLDQIILSSDNDEIISVAKSLGISVPFVRPAELARDDTLVVDVIAHALEQELERGNHWDYVCLLQVTAPLVQPTDYDKAIQKAVEQDADTVISVFCCDQHHPAIMFTKDESDRADWFLRDPGSGRMARRQDLPPVYMRSGLVYVFRASMIIEKRTLYGDRIYAIEVPQERAAIDINSTLDLKMAEFFMREKGYDRA